MHEIHPGLLWLGNALDLRNPRPLFELGVAAVVDVAFEEPPATLPRELIYCRFPLNDGRGNGEPILLLAVQTLVDLLSSGTRTIVACSAGMSRSPTIAAFGLAAFLSEDPKDVLARIAESKTLELNHALWDDVNRVSSRIRGNR